MSEATIQLYQDVNDRWRWRLVASDGHPLADGSQAFPLHDDLQSHLDRLKAVVPGLPIIDGGEGCLLLSGGSVIALDAGGTPRARATVETDAVDTTGSEIEDLPWGYLDAEAKSWLADSNLGHLPHQPVDPGVIVCHFAHDEEWRWSLHLDGEIVAESGEGYGSSEAVTSAASQTQSSIVTAEEDTWGSVQNA